MSSDVAIRLKHVSKTYHIYDASIDRLMQFIFPSLRKFLPDGVWSRLPQIMKRPSYYREFKAIHDASLEIKKGESVGIIGMNGAGKSTLLQLVAGILSPTSGAIEINGRMAGLFELGSGFNPEFSGRENIFLNGAILGFSKEEMSERLESILEFASIGDFIDQPVKTYSSGMLVRLAFAVQVQLEPDILIVDEALAVGDALFQKRCYSRIEKFLARGGTLLFVSHDQESVRTLTDRAVLLRHGRIDRIGSSSEVVLEYRRLLHEEENRYARLILKGLSGLGAVAGDGVSDVATPELESGGRTSRMSFGDMDVEIASVWIEDDAGNKCDLFYPGDVVVLKVEYFVRRDVSHLNFGVRLRNKEGVKIYSGGTFNEDLARGDEASSVWSCRYSENRRIILTMRFECRLGEGFYEVQAYVTEEQVFSPGHQRTLHWVDEAAFFRVSMNRFMKWYGGVCDISPMCGLEVE